MTTIYQVNTLIQDIAHRLSNTYALRATQITIAWQIVSFITHTSQAKLIAQTTISLDATQQEALEMLLHEHTVLHKPLAYSMGHMPFGPLTIGVRPPLLIPRPETENWVYDVITMLKKHADHPLTILDLCTGTGCIALALAHAFPNARIVGGDISPIAIAQAQANAQCNTITNAIFIESDLYTAVERLQFDLIVANPPYIDEALWPTLEPSVQLWEDPGALIAPQKGLALIEKIITHAPRYLKPNKSTDRPSLVIEIDYTQSEVVQQLFKQNNFSDIAVMQDLNGLPRVVMGKFSPQA